MSHAERRNLRRKLKGSIDVAQEVLNPRNQVRKLVALKKSQAKNAANETIQVVKKKAPLIGIVGAATLLVAARRPISRWISNLRKSKTNAPVGD
ncbi:hypothetical protein [Sphingorhabdus sp.]|uniref:hypothetical protein n=1 Tax=Sphingorhabdus sp. TaxID=1902408 RepID=UPI0037839B1B